METAVEISERYDIEFEQIGCDRDHIHLLCSAHPKVAPGQIVRVFKSITAREIFGRKPGVRWPPGVGWRVLDGRLLRGYRWRRRELGSDREVCTKPRQAEG